MISSTMCLLLFLAVLFFFLIITIIVLIGISHKEKKIAKLNKSHVLTNSYLLIYASQSGKTEAYAQQTAEHLQQAGESVILLNINQLTVQDLQDAQRVLWMVSTYGEGDSPDTAQKAIQALCSQKLNLDHQAFAVLAFGDRRYSQFCAFGQRIYTWLVEQNAQPWFDLVKVDQYSHEDLSYWNTQLEQVTSHILNVELSVKQWQSITLSSRTLLNNGSIGTGLYQIIFSKPEGLVWKSGDILEVCCQNCDAALQNFQNQYPQISEEYLPLLRYKNLKSIPDFLFDQTIMDWIDTFTNLPIREYSIASIPEQGYLELVVRQELIDHELGLGSGLLTEYLNIGDTLQVHIRSNSSFYLINNKKPVVLIGNGSGIAGLLAHLNQQELWGIEQNWLIFGERQKQFDSIYENKLQQWQQNKILCHIDLAFSRDESSIKYVQDVLFVKQEQLKIWLDNGAAIYVCGSLKGMAASVEQALIEILGCDYVSKLKSQNRYQRDVY